MCICFSEHGVNIILEPDDEMGASKCVVTWSLCDTNRVVLSVYCSVHLNIYVHNRDVYMKNNAKLSVNY
jgi:hypothetical protein